jgi:hypothetical protein
LAIAKILLFARVPGAGGGQTTNFREIPTYIAAGIRDRNENAASLGFRQVLLGNSASALARSLTLLGGLPVKAGRSIVARNWTGGLDSQSPFRVGNDELCCLRF